MFNSQTSWYIARSGGIVAWLLLSLSVIWGLLMSTRIVHGGSKRAWLLGVHRSLGGFAVIFTFIHIAGLLVHKYKEIQFSIVEVLVPFASNWRPQAVAWGVVSFWVLISVEVSSLLKKRISKNLWKYIHMTSLGLFLTAAIHGYTAGTDTGIIIFVFAFALFCAPIAILTIMRFGKSKSKVKQRPKEIMPSHTHAPESTTWEIQPPILTREEVPTSPSIQRPLEHLPEMQHQKIYKKHRGISSLFDEIGTWDSPKKPEDT